MLSANTISNTIGTLWCNWVFRWLMDLLWSKAACRQQFDGIILWTNREQIYFWPTLSLSCSATCMPTRATRISLGIVLSLDNEYGDTKQQHKYPQNWLFRHRFPHLRCHFGSYPHVWLFLDKAKTEAANSSGALMNNSLYDIPMGPTCVWAYTQPLRNVRDQLLAVSFYGS
jgi:hypothetical protein